MLKGTRILLYLGGEVFHYIESAYSLVDFLKKKKYKKTSRKSYKRHIWQEVHKCNFIVI